MAPDTQKLASRQSLGRRSFGMALVAMATNLKAKLTAKGKLRPHDMVRRKMPDGTALLDNLPRRDATAEEGDERAEAVYCNAIDRVTRVFGDKQRSQSTADEHLMY